ncbi:MAG: CoA transferase, partial [Chloroflexota bacterium]|nr:CoA transferase [Chloroflexota bacterium]
MSKLPLEGMRVVDFTQIQVGPQATLWLAVLGAEVIRIESHRRPDLLRMYAQLRDSKVEPSLNKSAVFNSLNFGKKSCTLNLTQPRAVELVKELVKISDVVVENFATGVIERLGLGYPILKEIN